MISRAQFLARSAFAACGAGGIAAVGPWLSTAVAQQGAGDVVLLNVALVLERLEAELYERSREVPDLSRAAKAIVREHGRHEREHASAIIDLIGRIGGEAGAAPRFALDRALASERAYLEVLQQLEDTGVAAYNAAGPLVRNPEVLDIAGRVVQVEARHAAAVRLLRGEDPAPDAFDRPLVRDGGIAGFRRAAVAKIDPFLV